jgi:hypothetical protein
MSDKARVLMTVNQDTADRMKELSERLNVSLSHVGAMCVAISLPQLEEIFDNSSRRNAMHQLNRYKMTPEQALRYFSVAND